MSPWRERSDLNEVPGDQAKPAPRQKLLEGRGLFPEFDLIVARLIPAVGPLPTTDRLLSKCGYGFIAIAATWSGVMAHGARMIKIWGALKSVMVAAALATFCAAFAAQAATEQAAPAKPVEIAYGDLSAQKLDVFLQPGLSGAPVLLYVHGGGFSLGDKANVGDLPDFARRHSFLLVSVGFRLAAGAGVEAQDVAAATAWAIDNAAKYGGDPKRVYLLGHSSGGNTVGLVAIDPTYLQPFGKNPDDLAGVVGLDGAAYNAASQMHQPFLLLQPPLFAMWVVAFGANPAAYSPTLLTKPEGRYPPFLLFYTGRPGFARYAEEFADRLRKAGDAVAVIDAKGKGHDQINDELGRAGDPVGERVAAFLTTGKP